MKVLTKKLLKQVNDTAIKYNLNRALDEAIFEVLPKDPSTLYPVTMSFMHNDDHMRVRFVYNEHGDGAWIDMSFEDFRCLPDSETLLAAI